MLGCKESRIGHDNGMRAFLGEWNWRAFVSYAETQYKSEYKDAFCPRDGVLRCVGPLESKGPGTMKCPHNFRVDLKQLGSVNIDKVQHHKELLSNMHFDHVRDLHHTCETWKQLSVKDPPRWDHNIDGEIVCSLLFGVKRTAAVPFVPLQFRGSPNACNCHHVSRPHNNHVIKVK